MPRRIQTEPLEAAAIAQAWRGGLTGAEARRRRQQQGPNALPEPPPTPAWRLLARQFASPLVGILLVALAIDLAVWLSQAHGVPLEAFAIGAILSVNAVLGYWQERKAERALAELRALAAPRAWVMRDGALLQVPATDLVADDVVRVEAGDRIPADMRVTSGDGLLLDEAVLTGESIPVDKSTDDELLSGTMLVRGKAWATVVRTGSSSAMGRIAGLLGAIRPEPTPLERRIARVGRGIALAVVALAAAIAVTGVLFEGLSQAPRLLLIAVALAVAAVPEGLPAALTFVLALGVQRMARRRAVVRRLAAVESLGSVSVIVSDKTGTITENQLEVRRLVADDENEALRAMVLANEAEVATGAGDPMDLALLRYADQRGLDVEAVHRTTHRHDSRPFDSRWGFTRTTVAGQDGAHRSYFKGAPEVLIDRSTLSDEARRRWLGDLARHASEGLRALGLASGSGAGERDLQWLGLVLLWDPPRPEVAEAVAQTRAAGLRVVMATGDHPATAQAVARAVGLDTDPLVLGEAIEALDDAALRDVARNTAVFARVTPEHKLRIVQALQEAGEVVAVTGDGVNDAPALKRSDIGVAMGRRGAAVSREVADLVLLDDHFATIVAAIEEGRSLFRNIRSFLRFLFSTNLSEVIVVAGGFVAALALDLRETNGALLLPLTAGQLLWINLVTDGAPALALALDRNPHVMRGRPRPRDEALLDRRSLHFIAGAGGIKAMIGVAILLALPTLGESTEAVRTALFVFLASGQVLLAYPSRRTGARPEHNAALHLAVVFGFVLQPALVLVPGLRPLLDLEPLSVTAWSMVLLAIGLSWSAAALIGRRVWP